MKTKKAEARKVRRFMPKLVLFIALVAAISVGYLLMRNDQVDLNHAEVNVEQLTAETVGKIDSSLTAINEDLRNYEKQDDQLKDWEEEHMVLLMKLKSDLIIERNRIRSNETTIRAIRIEVDRVVNALHDVQDEMQT
jgi:hypothetical protein